MADPCLHEDDWKMVHQHIGSVTATLDAQGKQITEIHASVMGTNGGGLKSDMALNKTLLKAVLWVLSLFCGGVVTLVFEILRRGIK